MKKQELTNKIKNEGVEEMRREEFWGESKKALTLEELDLIKKIIKSKNISNSTITSLVWIIQEEIKKEVIDRDLISKVSIIIAKIQNILGNLELIKIKAEGYKLDEDVERVVGNEVSLDDIPKDKRDELEVIAQELRDNDERENFIINSFMPLTNEELIIVSNALDKEITMENAKEYLDELIEIAYESTWINGKENYVEEYTNTLDLIVAKLKNM